MNPQSPDRPPLSKEEEERLIAEAEARILAKARRREEAVLKHAEKKNNMNIGLAVLVVLLIPILKRCTESL